jgi:protoporphyrinogen oxidase
MWPDAAPPRRVLVLGGGVCGLAAAHRLLQLVPGCEVTVLEAAARPGGLAACWRQEGFSGDLGPHRIYTELPEIEALLPELVARGETITVARTSQLLLDGHLYRYPVSAGELLSRLGPLRMVAFAGSAVAGKLRGALRAPANYEDAMVAAFGRRAYELIVAPYTRKVWKIEPSRLSEEVARVRVSAGNTNRILRRLLGRGERKGAQTALDSFAYIRGGAEGLVRSLAAKVASLGGRVETGVEARGLLVDRGRVTGVATASGDRPADFVISTIPVADLMGQAARVLPGAAASDALEAAGGLVTIGLILVGIVLRREYMSPNCWMYFPAEDIVFNRSYEPKRFDASMAPPGRTAGVFEVTSRWDAEPWTLPDDEVVAAVRRDAVRAGVVREADIESAFALRVPHTYPIYSLDYRSRLARVFAFLGCLPNLVSTGRQGLFNHNNMDHSMLVGIRAADYAAAGGDAAARWYADLGQFSHFRIVD